MPNVTETFALTPQRAAIFAALKYAGIATVTVSFSGGGDSGSIDDVSAMNAGGDPVDLPEDAQLQFTRSGELVAQTLKEAIIDLADAVLERCGHDWYNNEGGQGEVILHVEEQRIELQISINYMSSEDFSYDSV